MGKLIGYARVSTGDQNLDLQTDALKAAGVKSGDIYTDKASGARTSRPGLEKALQAMEPGDVLIAWKLDRVGRSLSHLISIAEKLNCEGKHIRILEGKGSELDTTTPQGKLMFSMFAAFAEYERELISERTKEGLKAARARGRKGGRPKGVADVETQQRAIKLKNANAMSIKEICDTLKISRNTYYKYTREA